VISDIRRSQLFVIGVVCTLVAGCGNSVSPTPTASSSASAAAASAASTPTAAPTVEPDLTLVAVGDSIPFNSNDDCPGCTGFVRRYASALGTATGKSVGVRNLSQHNGLQVEGLLDELGVGEPIGRAKDVAKADAIIVGIAHNDVPMNRDDDACDGAGGDDPDWSKFTDECIATEVARFTPMYEGVFKRIAELRTGKPTILRTVNRYNDWNGWPGHDLSAAGVAATAKVIKAWNRMICEAAEANEFTCADISTAFNGEDGTQPSGNLLARDYTHPSDLGNSVIADVLVKLGFAPLAP